MHAFVVIIQPILHYWIPAAGRKYGNKEQRNNWVIKGNREITYIAGSLSGAVLGNNTEIYKSSYNYHPVFIQVKVSFFKRDLSKGQQKLH